MLFDVAEEKSCLHLKTNEYNIQDDIEFHLELKDFSTEVKHSDKDFLDKLYRLSNKTHK